VRNAFVRALSLLVAVAAGVAVGRVTLPVAAVAQTAAPSAMPMGGGMMADCQAMHAMMQQAHSPADSAMMQGMMSAHQSMQSMHLTGDADHDFMVMMIPHDRMVVGIANAELQYGKDPKVLALAKNAVAAQQKDIDLLNGWLASGEAP
jgi:hypothetical protein